jgi:hypothetical protein
MDIQGGLNREKEMGLWWESPTQISAIVHSPGKIKLLMHCHRILAFSCPQPTFSARYLPHLKICCD